MISGKLPLVSIAALCYNQEGFLIETLDSIKNQTYSNIEVILLDDCSNDNSVEIIEKWLEENNCSWRFIKHAENQGLCKTANEALSFAKGDYFQLIACDDIMHHDKIEEQVKIYKSSPEDVAVVCGDLELIDAESNTIGIDQNAFENDLIEYDDLLKECIVRAPTVLIKKQIFEIVGKYDDNLYFEDWDLWLRIVKVAKIKKENRINIKYRRLSTSMYSQSSNPWYLESIYRVMQKQLPSANNVHRDIINRRFLQHIEYFYITRKKKYWFKVVRSNKFSLVALIHYTAASCGFKYSFVKSIINSGKRITNG